MREIKFRAWVHNKMWLVRTLNLMQDGENGCMDIWEPFGNTCTQTSQRSCNLMQYTGLKDKNGIEIYEGDIIQYSEEEYLNKDKKEVFFDNGCFRAGSQSLNELQLSKLWKVIGNIYENPELLE